jgi:hypothetical protein
LSHATKIIDGVDFWKLEFEIEVFMYNGDPILILLRTTLNFWGDGESGRLPIHSSLSWKNREYLNQHGERQSAKMKRNSDLDIM